MVNSAKDRWLRNLSKKVAKCDLLPSIVSDSLFLLAVFYDSFRILCWRRAGIYVVQDRYYLSYKWYLETLGKMGRNTRLSTLPIIKVFRRLFLKPSVTFLCYSSPAMLRNRYLESFNQGRALSENDRIIYSANSGGTLSSHQRYFRDELGAGCPNVIFVENNGSFEELRSFVRRSLLFIPGE